MLRSEPFVATTPPVPRQQVGLEEDVFQKLLEAAWVLQEMQDRKDSRQLPFQFTSQPANQNDPTAPSPAKQNVLASTALASAMASGVAQPTLLGSLTLGTDTFSEYGLEPPETEPPMEATAEPVGAVAKTIDTASRHSSKPWPVVRLRLNAKQGQALRVAAAVVLAVAAYAMFQTRAHKPGQAVAATTNSTDTRVEARAGTAPTKRPGQMSTDLSSHKEVTDVATQNALYSLSKFEMRTLRRQAQFGDDSAALTLGMAYETGYNVRQNCRTAADWVTRAAKDGNPAAEYNLGLRYEVGDGVPVDPELAATWIRKSALRKYAKAQSLLASSSVN